MFVSKNKEGNKGKDGGGGGTSKLGPKVCVINYWEGVLCPTGQAGKSKVFSRFKIKRAAALRSRRGTTKSNKKRGYGEISAAKKNGKGPAGNDEGKTMEYQTKRSSKNENGE